MRTLTDVFAPGMPTLPEGLRTLAVSPERELEPGMTVRASFTFRNQGGAPATGVRVRFNLPDGLVYLVGSGQLDGCDLDDEHGNSPLLSRPGAQIGDVAPGEERRIDIAYSVAGAIENGSAVELQAAVAAFELAPVGSNVVRLVAHSRPALENALTNVQIEARQSAHSGLASPGTEAAITVRIHNAGESSAHDLVVVSPIPEHTSYVPNSARVNGRELESDLLAAFDRVHAPIVAALLPASATATLQYRVRIDDPLEDGIAIIAHAHIASQETAAFALAPATLTVRAQAAFDDDRTTFDIDPERDLAPGSRLSLRVAAYNAGSTTAADVTVSLDLPASLVPVRGAFRLDGRPLRERKRESMTFDLGSIPSRELVEFRGEATLLSPAEDGAELPLRATLRWASGERTFDRSAIVQSRPYFAARRNRVERSGGPVVRPSDECEAVLFIANDGSAPASNAVVSLRATDVLHDLRVFDKTVRLEMGGEAIDLGTIEPYGSRKLIVRGRVRTPCADRSEARLSVALRTHELGELSLGEALWRVDSHPAFTGETSRLQLVQDDVFRPNQLVEVDVRLQNGGTDGAINVRVRLFVSPDARLESVEGATRDRTTLLFGEIAPGGTAEARLGIRLLRAMAKAHPVTIEAVLSADAMLPVQLPQLAIVTTAEPNFSVGTLRSDPADTAEAGVEVEYTLHLRNGGDGPAREAHARVEMLDALIYVPNSTLVNGVPVRDAGAQSPVMTEAGITLSDVDPGVEATIQWREVVHNALPAGETIVRRARVSYDGDRTDEIAAAELKVRCEPAFANTIAGLPFGLTGMVGPSFGAGQRALPDADRRFLQLPPALPVHHEETLSTAVISLAPSSNGHPFDPEAQGGTAVHTVVTFDASKLQRTLKFLAEARFTGLATHLFALRAFVADRAGAQADEALARIHEELQETLDRLFIKLRLPNYVIAARDLETAASRAALDAFLRTVVPAQIVDARDDVVLHGSCHPQELHHLRDRMQSAPIGTALPWAALARFLPDETEATAHYRRMLISSLDDLAGVDDRAFTDALQRRRYPVLDAALDVVRASLAVYG